MKFSNVETDPELAKDLAEIFDLVVVPDEHYEASLEAVVEKIEEDYYILNDFGKRIWTKGNLSAERSYDWVDRIILIDESEGRKVVSDLKYSQWDSTGWTPMTKQTYKGR